MVVAVLTLLCQGDVLFNLIREAFGLEQVIFFQKAEYFKPLFVYSGVWQNMGFNSVIYIAALSAIDPQLYEAAAMDGATKWQQVLHVTIRHLRTMIAILFIMNVGKICASDFGLFYNVPMQNGALFSVTQTIDTYVYRAYMATGDPGQSSAAGLLQNVLGFVCILTANGIVKKIDSESSLF